MNDQKEPLITTIKEETKDTTILQDKQELVFTPE